MNKDDDTNKNQIIPLDALQLGSRSKSLVTRGLQEVSLNPDQPEVILNLWYVADNLGLIYSLRVRAYVAFGSDEEKLKQLRRTADVDYLIAKPFPVPKRFHTRIMEGNTSKQMPVVPMNILGVFDSYIALWEDAIKALESEFPAQSNLSVPQDPIVCVTPLFGDDSGNIWPRYRGQALIKDLEI
jgi:hypothetical protein